MLLSEDKENWILKTFNGDKMTFASLEKLIREETRRVIENLERSFSLYEEDEKPASEDSEKMRVVNKESGKTYYINKDSFDPAKHDVSTAKEPTKEEEEPAADTATPETPAEEPAPTETPAAEEPAADTTTPETPETDTTATDTTTTDTTSTETPAETPTSTTDTAATDTSGTESKTGLKTVGAFTKVDVEKLDAKTNNLYPKTREHLLQYDYEDIIDMYDLSIGDKKVDFAKLFKRAEMIALSKHYLISQRELDKQTILALQHYYINSIRINNIIRFSQPSATKQDIKKQIKLGKPKEGDKREKAYNSAMNAFTINELDYAFSEEPQRLESSIISYRSIKNEDVLQLFIDEGQWIDKSFVTTSLNPFICEGTEKKRMPLFEFFIPAGTSILTLPCHSNDYCHETEVTLPRNCRYTIQGFNNTRNIYKVLVEQRYA
jgi:uncharacterized lipoprotein YehR (DUF1307 family)